MDLERKEKTEVGKVEDACEMIFKDRTRETQQHPCQGSEG